MILLLSYYSIYYATKISFWTLRKLKNIFYHEEQCNTLTEEPVYITRKEFENIENEQRQLLCEVNRLKVILES